MNDIPNEFICPITLELMIEPVICEDGYTYERQSIICLPNSISPITRQYINKNNLIINRNLKQAIERYNNKENNNKENNNKENNNLNQPTSINKIYIIISIYIFTIYYLIYNFLEHYYIPLYNYIIESIKFYYIDSIKLVIIINFIITIYFIKKYCYYKINNNILPTIEKYYNIYKIITYNFIKFIYNNQHNIISIIIISIPIYKNYTNNFYTFILIMIIEINSIIFIYNYYYIDSIKLIIIIIGIIEFYILFKNIELLLYKY